MSYRINDSEPYPSTGMNPNVEPVRRSYAAPTLEPLGSLVARTAGPDDDAPENVDALIGQSGGFRMADPS